MYIWHKRRGKKINLYIINLLYRRVFHSSSACAVDWYQRHDCTGNAWANKTRVQIIIVAISSCDMYMILYTYVCVL